MQERQHDVGAGGVEDPPLEPRPGDPAAPASEGAASERAAPEPAPPGPAAPGPTLPDLPAVAPATVAPVVVPRWIQAVVLPLAIVGAYLLLRAAGPVALIFIVAALVALLLNPFVTMLRRARFPRGLAVPCVFLALIAVLGAIVAVLADPIGDQVSRFSNAVPGIVDDANAELADLQEWLDDNGIDVEVAKQGETALETLGARITEGSGELVSFT